MMSNFEEMALFDNDIQLIDMNIERLSDSVFSHDEERIHVTESILCNVTLWSCGSYIIKNIIILFCKIQVVGT